jgi:hypothetical protein
MNVKQAAEQKQANVLRRIRMAKLLSEVREWRRVSSILKANRNNEPDNATAQMLQRISLMDDRLTEAEDERKAAEAKALTQHAELVMKLDKIADVAMGAMGVAGVTSNARRIHDF